MQLIFFVPGIDETLRVGGKGKLSADPDLLASMDGVRQAAARGAEHRACSEAYFHCGKALMRSKLWSQETRVERAVLPSIAEVIHDQTSLGEPESQAAVEARYKDAVVEIWESSRGSLRYARASAKRVVAQMIRHARLENSRFEDVAGLAMR